MPIFLADSASRSAESGENIRVDFDQAVLHLGVMQGDGEDFVVGIAARNEGTSRVEITAANGF